jgi:hypothetical protein
MAHVQDIEAPVSKDQSPARRAQPFTLLAQLHSGNYFPVHLRESLRLKAKW